MSDERLHIGVVAAGKRDILPGHEYDKYFPKPDHENTKLKLSQILCHQRHSAPHAKRFWAYS